MVKIVIGRNPRFFAIFLLIISSTVRPLNVYSQQRICEIKYGEKISEKRLEKKFFRNDLPESIIKKYGFDCYQIGVEHDSNKRPLQNKPIYSCCYNYNPIKLDSPNLSIE